MSRIERDLEQELEKIPVYRKTQVQRGLYLFRKYDRNSDKKITFEEFNQICHELRVINQEFPDFNSDGYIGILEFLHFFLQLDH